MAGHFDRSLQAVVPGGEERVFGRLAVSCLDGEAEIVSGFLVQGLLVELLQALGVVLFLAELFLHFHDFLLLKNQKGFLKDALA